MGGFVRVVKKVAQVAAPVVGGMLGGPAGAAAGGALSGVMGGGNRHDILKRAAINATISGAVRAGTADMFKWDGSPGEFFSSIGGAAAKATHSPGFWLGVGGSALAFAAANRKMPAMAMPDAVTAPQVQQQSFADLQERAIEQTREAFQSFPSPRVDNVGGTFKSYSPTYYDRDINFYNRRNFSGIRKLKSEILRQKMAAQLRKKQEKH